MNFSKSLLGDVVICKGTVKYGCLVEVKLLENKRNILSKIILLSEEELRLNVMESLSQGTYYGFATSLANQKFMERYLAQAVQG